MVDLAAFGLVDAKTREGFGEALIFSREDRAV